MLCLTRCLSDSEMERRISKMGSKRSSGCHGYPFTILEDLAARHRPIQQVRRPEYLREGEHHYDANDDNVPTN